MLLLSGYPRGPPTIFIKIFILNSTFNGFYLTKNARNLNFHPNAVITRKNWNEDDIIAIHRRICFSTHFLKL